MKSIIILFIMLLPSLLVILAYSKIQRYMENVKVRKKYPIVKENISCDLVIKKIRKINEKAVILEFFFKVTNNNHFKIALETPSDSYNILIFHRFLDEVKYIILNPRRGCIQPYYKTILKNDILTEKMEMEMDNPKIIKGQYRVLLLS